MNILSPVGHTHSVLALSRKPTPVWLRRLRAALPDTWSLIIRDEDAAGDVEATDLVVIGTDHPLRLARRIDQGNPRVHLVLVAEGASVQRLRQTLALSGLRAGFTVLDLRADATDWTETLSRAAREARQARRMRGTLDQVNALIAGTGAAASNAAGPSSMPESYLASLLTHLPKAVFSTDLTGRVVSWNPAAEALFGREVDDASELGFGRLFRPGDRERVRHSWQRARSARETTHLALKIDRRDGTRSDVSLLFAPIRHYGQIAGVLAVAEDVTDRLQAQRERRLALRRERRAREALQRTLGSLSERERIARFLSEASAVLASSLDYAATLTRVAELAVPEFADWCAVDIVDDSGHLQQLAVARSEHTRRTPGISRRYTRSRRYGPSAVVASGEPQLVGQVSDALLREYAADAAELATLREWGPQSYMCLPLIARDQTLGTLTLVSLRTGHRYGAEDLAVGREIALRAALAVDNARLYRSAQRELTEREQAQRQLAIRARQQEAVAQLGHTALARGDLDRVLQEAVHQVAQTLDVGLSDVHALGPDGTRLQLRAAHGWPRERLGAITMASSETMGGRALAQNRPVIMEELGRAPSSPALAPLRELGAISGVSVVIPGDTGPYGVLGAFSKRSRRFSREDVSFLEAVASVIAAAIRRFDLESALRRQAEELALADRRKNEFLAMLAHELRNPLGAAHNAVELLGLRGHDPGTRATGVEVMGVKSTCSAAWWTICSTWHGSPAAAYSCAAAAWSWRRS